MTNINIANSINWLKRDITAMMVRTYPVKARRLMSAQPSLKKAS